MFIWIFGLENQKLYYCSFYGNVPTFALNYFRLLRLRSISFAFLLFTVMLTNSQNLLHFPINADLSLDSKNQNKTCTSKIRLNLSTNRHFKMSFENKHQ